jgi:hypothetical protein
MKCTENMAACQSELGTELPCLRQWIQSDAVQGDVPGMVQNYDHCRLSGSIAQHKGEITTPGTKECDIYG